jgi:hypothetical protein
MIDPNESPAEEPIKTEGAAEPADIPASDPQEPAVVVNETTADNAARHQSSLRQPVGEVTHPSTQAQSIQAKEASKLIVPGAAVGPDLAGVVRNDHGDVAFAPAGSHNASIHTDNSSTSGVRTY